MDNQKKPKKIYISTITENKLKEKCQSLLGDVSRGWLGRYMKFISESEFVLLDNNTQNILRALLSNGEKKK